MNNLAISRRADVVSRVEGDETLILDLQTQTAHCLSGDVALVWASTETSVAEVALATGLSVEAVEAAVATLRELGLVVAPAGLSRRTLITRGAALGGAVVAAGAISMPLPAAANAASSTIKAVAPSGSSTGGCSSNKLSFTIVVAAGGKLLPSATYTLTGSYKAPGTTGTSGSFTPTTFQTDANGAITGNATFTTANNFLGTLSLTITSGTDTKVVTIDSSLASSC